MGRKQRLKKDRHEPGAQARPAAARRSRIRWDILALVFLVLGVGVAAGLVYLRAHPAKWIRASLLSASQGLQAELDRRQGFFTLEEGRRLQAVLGGIAAIAADKTAVDARVGAHLNFILQVSGEIIRSGKLEEGELAKLEALLDSGKKELARSGPPREKQP